MANAPLDSSGDLDPRRLFLADLERHRLRRPGLRRPPPGPLLVQPVRQRLERPTDHRWARRHQRRDGLAVRGRVRHRHGHPGLEPRSRRAGREQLRRPRLLRRREAVRAGRDGQRHGRHHPGQLRPVDPALPRRPADRHALADAAAVPRPGRRPGRDHRPRRPDEPGHDLRATTTDTTTGASASSAASAGSTSSTPRPSPAALARGAAGGDPLLVPHRRLLRRSAPPGRRTTGI